MAKNDRKKGTRKKAAPRKKKAADGGETTRLVLRLPASIKESLEVGERAPGRGQLDWSPVREVLDDWAERGGAALEPEVDPTEQVCFHVAAGTAEALREEAERLTEETGAKWTVSMVVAALWAEAQA